MAQEASERVLSAGELVMLTQGKEYYLHDAPGRSGVNIQQMIETAEQGPACSVARFGGAGSETHMLCGSFQFRAGRHRMILRIAPVLGALHSQPERAWTVAQHLNQE